VSDGGIGPADGEVEAWALRERQLREQWVRGPTPEQTALWALRERERRVLEHEKLASPNRGAMPLARALREVQLASIGALRLAVNTSIRDAVEYLVQAGLDWEEELPSRSRPRRR
jgi:hypothetical protein